MIRVGGITDRGLPVADVAGRDVEVSELRSDVSGSDGPLVRPEPLAWLPTPEDRGTVARIAQRHREVDVPFHELD